MPISIPRENASVSDATSNAAILFRGPITKTYPAASENADLTIADYSTMTKLSVRADPSSSAAQQLAAPFGSSRLQGTARVVGIRPDEWFVLGGHDDAHAVVGGLDTSGHVSVVDLTHSRCMFRVTGAQGPKMMEKVCGIDWSDAMTPEGAATAASVALVSCDLMRADEAGVRSYLIACDRSFGQYLFDALLDAGDEFGIAVSAES